MGCYRPLKGYRSLFKDSDTRKRRVFFNPRQGYHDQLIELACGQCMGCRLERSRQWAIRMSHEAACYDRNCFITLTYRDECLPPHGSLDVKHFQDFMKRLRFRFGSGIRFFHCGEYGEKFARPHYHACLFNFDFPDKKLWRTVRENRLFTSEALEQLWPFGFSTVGEVTFESAAYVARYVTKKVTGRLAEDHYGVRKPEYTTMSRRPGIGRPWFEKFRSDVYPSDQVVLRGRAMRPPKFYDSLFEVAYPSDFAKVKARRRKSGLKYKEELFRLSNRDVSRWRDRLSDLEYIQELKFKQLKRGYEDGS